MAKNQTSFNSLPSDCRISIFDHLSREDLPSLALVSKDLHAFTVLFMYRTISWTWDVVPLHQILCLLRTTFQRPELASCIHHVSILSSPDRPHTKAWEKPWHDMDWEKESPKYDDVIQKAQNVVNRAQFPNPSRWNQAIRLGDPYSLVAILLSQLHQLKSLRLDYSFVWVYGFPGLMLRHALFAAPKGIISSFELLSVVDYGGNVRLSEEIEALLDTTSAPGYPTCDHDQFTAWFYLPSLRSLSIWVGKGADIRDAIENPGQQPNNLHQLHTLVLPRTTINETDLPPLLSQTTALKTLHLGLAYRWSLKTPLQDGPAILQALEHIRTTVTNLSLGLEYYPYLVDCYTTDQMQDYKLREPFDRFLKNLNFRHLRSAEVPVTLLLNMDPDSACDIGEVLPDTLEELCIQWDFSEVGTNTWGSEGQLVEVVRWLMGDEARASTPRLRRVAVRILSFMRVDVWGVEWAEARARCAQKGIEMEVVYDELSPGLWTSRIEG